MLPAHLMPLTHRPIWALLRAATPQAAATCKHFVAYSLEGAEGWSRFSFDARIAPQDMADTYLPAFQACVQEADAVGVMCSYNRVSIQSGEHGGACSVMHNTVFSAVWAALVHWCKCNQLASPVSTADMCTLLR
jgi:hypothetical protein